MTDRLAYRVTEAAEAAGVSQDIIRRALRATDPEASPPPLRAKRLSTAPNAPHLIAVDDLRDWIARLPDAS